MDAASGASPTLAVVGVYGFSRALKSEVYARQFTDGAQTAGYVIGLLSTVFYLGSRLPQIIMNFKRGKTDGVHPGTFLLAVVANFAYAFSVNTFENGKKYICIYSVVSALALPVLY